MTVVRTTIQPDREIEVSDAELLDLRRMGLLVEAEPEPAPAPEAAPEPTPAPAPEPAPSSRPGKTRRVGKD